MSDNEFKGFDPEFPLQNNPPREDAPPEPLVTPESAQEEPSEAWHMPPFSDTPPESKPIENYPAPPTRQQQPVQQPIFGMPQQLPQPVYAPPGQPQPAPPAALPKPKKQNAGLKLLCVFLAICLCVCSVVAGVAILSGNKEEMPAGDPNAPMVSANETPVAQPPTANAGELLSPEQVAAKIRPSVVGIVVYASGSANRVAGEGSGIIMDADKTGTYTYVVTCAHVISDSGVKIFVQLESGKQYEAKVVGLDRRTDLGVLRIQATGLPKAEFGQSGKLTVGSPVYAVGNPGGMKYFGSFTNGIVSAIGRDVTSESSYTMECVQHNAAISPGNSGGALVNGYGQVVGINSMKIMGGEYEGMGFAIPMDIALGIINKLVAKGYVPDRPKLGIGYYSVSTSASYSMVVQANNLPAGSLIIGNISPESSLAKTEAKQFDMIIAVNGKNMDEADLLLDIIEQGKVGDVLTLTLCRVSADYEISKFDIKATLIEDKGDTVVESTGPDVLDPFS